jgi:hypothetical protein
MEENMNIWNINRRKADVALAAVMAFTGFLQQNNDWEV